MWKWLLAIGLVLLLGCVGSGFYLQSTGKLDEIMKKIRPELRATEVRLGTAAKGVLVRTVSAPGQVEPKTNVEISAQVSARIIGLPFRENAQVKAGDAVVRLDARDLAALLDSAKAQLKSEEARLEGAKAAHTNARTELGRVRELLSSRDAAQAELERAEAEFSRVESTLRVAEFSIEIARANILRAEKDLDNTTITAPFDGVITKLNAEVGELVVVGTLNNAGSVIMEIADLSVMLVKARVDEANIAPVKEGQKARVFVNAYPDKTFIGTVDHVGLKRQMGQDGTAFFETHVLLDLPPGLVLPSGLTANVDIEVETFRDIVKVPSQAVLDRPIEELPAKITDGNQHIDPAKKFARVVFTIKDGKAVPIPVSVGPSDLTHTVITGGLPDGTAVVVGPFKALVGLRNNQLAVEQGTVPKPGEPKSAEKPTPVAGGT